MTKFEIVVGSRYINSGLPISCPGHNSPEEKQVTPATLPLEQPRLTLKILQNCKNRSVNNGEWESVLCGGAATF